MLKQWLKQREKKQKHKENKALEKAREIEKMSWVETDFEVNGMAVAAIKLQLEKYRSRIQDIPKKSELNKIKKPGLVAFLKTVIAQYTSSFHSAQVQTEQPTAHSALPLVVNEDKLLHIEIPTEIDKLLVPQIREQLELYRSHIESIPKKAA